MDVQAIVLLVLLVIVHFESKFLNLDRSETFDITEFFENAVDFGVGISNKVMPQLFFVGLFLDFFGTREDSLDIGERRVNFRVLELIMLVERSFRAIGFSTGLDSTFVESLNFVGVSPEPLGLLISFKGTVTLLILNYGGNVLRIC